MPLKKCKDCNNEVSSDAHSCPHCGKPIKSKGLGCLSTIGIVFFGFVAFAIVMAVLGSKSTTSTKDPGAEVLRIEKGWKWVVDGDYSYIRGSVKNVGHKPIRYFEVKAHYRDAKKQIRDTDYANSTEILPPNAAKKFEISHQHSNEYETVELFVDKVRVQ